jgi:signal transduction histidine kinase
MNPDNIIRHATKQSSHSSVNLFKSLIPPKIAQEKATPFASALAHEVRNPLTNINLAVEMLKATLKDDEQKGYLDIILRGSGRINDLVTDLLMLCQGDELLPGMHSIHQLLDQVLTMTQDRISLKNITVSREYSTVDCKILLDKEKMKIALTNIIINAIDAMPSEGGRLKLVTKSVNGRCIIEVEDNGIGISEENLKNIFMPYFTNKPGGMGLGLSTTLDILKSNHARVDVQSVEGKGTRFILSFDRNQQSGNWLFDGSVPIVA